MTWQIGDLALCVIGRKWRQTSGPQNPGPLPVSGGIYTVSYVFDDWLKFEEFGFEKRFKNLHFRKIRPSAIRHIEALKRVPATVREVEPA